jgi:hypothetical protein
MKKLGISVATAGLAIVGVGVALAPAAQASTVRTASATAHVVSAADRAVKPNDCSYQYYFNANGVRIHTQASTSSTVLGLGYAGQYLNATNYSNGFYYGQDESTGVTGWVAGQYITYGLICEV